MGTFEILREVEKTFRTSLLFESGIAAPSCPGEKRTANILFYILFLFMFVYIFINAFGFPLSGLSFVNLFILHMCIVRL